MDCACVYIFLSPNLLAIILKMNVLNPEFAVGIVMKGKKAMKTSV